MGGQGESKLTDLGAHEWRVAVGYRYLHGNQFFLGDQVNNSFAPFGAPIIYHIHSADVTVTYAATDRFSLNLTVPVLDGTQSAVRADTVRHDAHAVGLGDISLVGSAWLLNPRTHAKGNVALGLGVKAPTGSNRYADSLFRADGSWIQYPVDQSIQPGDGGWGVILQMQAFRRLFAGAVAYLAGAYLVSPRALSDVSRPAPNSSVYWSVPDVYSARVGLMYLLLPTHGLSVSLGGRIDGIPYHDLVGGGDAGFRRPGHVVFLDPAVALTRGRSTFTVSSPIRVSGSLADSAMVRPNGVPSPTRSAGDLARMLIFVGYSRRF
ncbi:MAG: hypothetical protein DMD28_04280 [Gemmatimonadetes bacterium]|nr:MAG: hypothetical protein DMD28_04280 [Gemmatimonadota bacterium]